MFDGGNLQEPPIDPLADTNPSLSIRPAQAGGVSAWRRIAGMLSLLAAAGFTIATVLLLVTTPESAPENTPNPPTQTLLEVTFTPAPTDLPSITPAPDTTALLLPTASSETIAALLDAPLQLNRSGSGSIVLVDNPLKPFTTIPDRARTEIIQYTAVRGDTIYTIAERFGLQPETIAWSNPRRFVQVLYPGDVLNILPVNGVLHVAIANKTLAEIAAQYKVEPYTIIDSEFNALSGATPNSIPGSGTRIVVPGGIAEEITWNPGVELDSRTGYVRAFAPGQAGSCGQVAESGGAYWSPPLNSNYTFVRGFSAFHTGVDLSASTGTPVYAANSGPVLYSGWNTWGYGNVVVLGHGPYSTLYGHLNETAVRCGQFITVGQIIGYVGSTGNSSGPHLHFEIRYQDTPTDPAATIGF